MDREERGETEGDPEVTEEQEKGNRGDKGRKQITADRKRTRT